MRVTHEGHFVSFDSTPVPYQTWEPIAATSKKALIVLARDGSAEGLICRLNLADTWAFTFESRGEGGEFSDEVRDLDQFVKFISDKHGIPFENMALVASAVDAVVGAVWVHDYAPRIRAVVLSSISLRMKYYGSLAIAGLRLLTLVNRPAFSVGLYDASTRLLESASSIATPALILMRSEDFPANQDAQKKFFAGLGSAVRRMKTLEHGDDGCAVSREFILDALSRPLDRTGLLSAHKVGASRTVFEKLTAKPGFADAALFGLQKISMGTLGRLSQGIRVGLKSGFDSGLSLDYIYENKARGATLLGRLVDFVYLNTVGWRSLRQRKINLERQIEIAMMSLSARGETIRILDIAGGAGRYLLDVVDRHREKDIRVVICDNVEENLAQGRAMAQNLGLHSVSFQRVDAFGTEGVPGYKPNIVVISGLFELVSDNDLVRKAVSRVATAAGEGAALIYTGQPYHPRQEAIARTLKASDGKPWVMRLRSQAELDEIIRCHGFDKTNMMIDPDGIFTVSTAIRRPLISIQARVITDRGTDAKMTF